MVFFFSSLSAVCNFISHEKCIPYLKVPCRHVLAEHIQVCVVCDVCVWNICSYVGARDVVLETNTMLTLRFSSLATECPSN